MTSLFPARNLTDQQSSPITPRHSSPTRFLPCLTITVAMLLCVFAQPSLLLAQTTSEQKLTEAYRLQRQGKSAGAITLLTELLEPTSLDPTVAAKAWDVLGLAEKDSGDFTAARRAFERSVQTYEALPDAVSDRARVLDDFAELYVLTGQLELAESMMRKALHLYDSAHDHAGVTRGSNYLAGVLFSQKKLGEGKAVLHRAVQEARRTTELDGDDLASLAFLQGWLAKLEGNLQSSEAKYQESLALLRKGHGDEHASTGWSFVLLGQAHADLGDVTTSLGEMRKGIAILERTLTRQDPRYLTAELAYSRVLESAGEVSEAQALRMDAEEGSRAFRRKQCLDCTVSAQAFR